MVTFTPRVMRLLSDWLTGTPVREIDALFDDRGVALGPPQPRENDESVRRERMRRYLATLDLDDAADAQRLAAVFGEVVQKIIQGASIGWDGNDVLRDKPRNRSASPPSRSTTRTARSPLGHGSIRVHGTWKTAPIDTRIALR